MLCRFREVYILTHLFEGSDMSAYLRLHNVPVKKATIGLDGNLVDYDEDIERARLDRVKPLIHVVDDKSLNDIGTRSGRSNPLSVGWFETDLKKRGGKQVERLKKNTYSDRSRPPDRRLSTKPQQREEAALNRPRKGSYPFARRAPILALSA